MQIAIPIYPAFTALDAIGPYEVLQRLPGAEVVFCAETPGPVRTEQGMAAVVADAALTDVSDPDVIVVPGGIGNRGILDPDSAYCRWAADVHERTEWTTSVCTGSLILAAAGVLDGVEATTHWAARGLLGELGAVPVAERVVERGRIVTAAGVSAGIDMALHLAGRIAGTEVAQAIQLGIEYDPEPPHSTGSLERAPQPVVEQAGIALAAEDGRAARLHGFTAG